MGSVPHVTMQFGFLFLRWLFIPVAASGAMERVGYSHGGVVFMKIRTSASHLNSVRSCTRKMETTYKLISGSTVRIQLWRARIRTGCYQVNGQTLAACILIKEAHFFRL